MISDRVVIKSIIAGTVFSDIRRIFKYPHRRVLATVGVWYFPYIYGPAEVMK